MRAAGMHSATRTNRVAVSPGIDGAGAAGLGTEAGFRHAVGVLLAGAQAGLGARITERGAGHLEGVVRGQILALTRLLD